MSFQNFLVYEHLTEFSYAVHEIDPDCIREGPLDVHGAVGVSQWHCQVPCILQLHQEEEHDRAKTQAGYTQGEPQVCGEPYECM